MHGLRHQDIYHPECGSGEQDMNEVTPRAYVFDAYGTLFDVHAAIGRYRAAAGPDADRFSELWRTKQLEYSWTLTLAGRYLDFWSLTERALDYALARFPSIDCALRQKLLDAYLKLDAFPDAPAAVAYKPRPEVYALVTARFAIKPEDAVFVSSNRWDVMGAAAFGFRPL
jgi:2-haloacid dehalogenase